MSKEELKKEKELADERFCENAMKKEADSMHRKKELQSKFDTQSLSQRAIQQKWETWCKEGKFNEALIESENYTATLEERVMQTYLEYEFVETLLKQHQTWYSNVLAQYGNNQRNNVQMFNAYCV